MTYHFKFLWSSITRWVCSFLHHTCSSKSFKCIMSAGEQFMTLLPTLRHPRPHRQVLRDPKLSRISDTHSVHDWEPKKAYQIPFAYWSMILNRQHALGSVKCRFGGYSNIQRFWWSSVSGYGLRLQNTLLTWESSRKSRNGNIWILWPPKWHTWPPEESPAKFLFSSQSTDSWGCWNALWAPPSHRTRDWGV